MLKKIKNDELFSMEKLMGAIAREGREQEKDRIDDYSAIVHFILSLSVDKF